MTLSHTEYVEGIFQAVLFRPPSATELANWTEQLDLGLQTPLTLTLLGAEQPTFEQTHLPLASAFFSAFGRLITAEEIDFWRSVLNQGASLEQVAAAFVNSEEFKARFDGMSLAQIHEVMTGVPLSPEQEASYASRLEEPGAILLEVAEQHNSKLAIGLGLLESAFQTTTRDYQALVALGDDVVPVLSQVLDDIADNSVGGITLDGSELSLDVAATSTISIDLESHRLTIDGEDSSTPSNTLALVQDVDATIQSGVPVSFSGDSQNNTYRASEHGDTIRGQGGDDSIILGAGQDSLVFAASALANGQDVITGFDRGEAGDSLDFTPFLNLPSTANITTREASETAALPWSNADILVVSGQGLTAAAAVAGFFTDQDLEQAGHQAVFAAPEGASKNVVITAGITGSASVWYLVNAENVNQIETSEVMLVGSLQDVNNLGLVGFHENNFQVPE